MLLFDLCFKRGYIVNYYIGKIGVKMLWVYGVVWLFYVIVVICLWKDVRGSGMKVRLKGS